MTDGCVRVTPPPLSLLSFRLMSTFSLSPQPAAATQRTAAQANAHAQARDAQDEDEAIVRLLLDV